MKSIAKIIDLPLVCPDPSEFVRPFPWRSPLCIVEAIKDIITGKTVCDVGCGEGDIMAQMAKHAKSVIGIEKDPARYSVAINRGLDILVGDFTTCEIPVVEVYYTWTYGEMFLKTADILFERFSSFKLITGGQADMPVGFNKYGNAPGYCHQLMDKYGGEFRVFPYLENSVLDRFPSQGFWWLLVMEKSEEKEIKQICAARDVLEHNV
jgi:hypothetical protein